MWPVAVGRDLGGDHLQLVAAEVQNLGLRSFLRITVDNAISSREHLSDVPSTAMHAVQPALES
ncbi:MAG TPA: hypothetical protein VFO20_01040 [Propionibacteriaceae bacterium]|nr:hypothetical protein [Propionibacteriaceae bacterium]